MIFLFDKCFLSTTNHIVEDAKHVWIGKKEPAEHEYEPAFDVYKMVESITPAKIDTLFKDIHANLSDSKVIIYCDVDTYQLIYSFYFGALLSEEGLREMYKLDRLKENYNIGTSVFGIHSVGSRDIKFVTLPETLTVSTKKSKFALTVSDYRIELALANGLSGDSDMMTWCIDRAVKIYKGSPGFTEQFVEQFLPALLQDKDYTLENLTSDTFLQEYLSKFKFNEYVPAAIHTNEISVDFLVGFDHVNHMVNVINDNNMTQEDIASWWEVWSTLDKNGIMNFLLVDDISNSEKYQLAFPNMSNFDTINPILWNTIIKNRDDATWLKLFKVNYGTNNQTDGTV